MQKHKISCKNFVFETGETLDSIDIVYHTSPRAYRPGDKVIWICHALTANSDPEDWWPTFVGKGKLVDPDRHYVVCVNMLGSPYGSSGPASINPATGKPFYFDFPAVTVRDIVSATIIVRKHLGINAVDMLVGSSIGGFQALEWAIMEPEIIKNAVFMATAVRISAYLTAYEESQRMALEADQTFRKAESLKGGEAGLRCARTIALISYRYYDGYNMTQTDPDPDTLFAQRACSYQQYQGKKFADRFDAYSYWYLSNSLDSHNPGRGRGGVRAALERIQANCTVVAIDSDCIFPEKGMRDIVEVVKGTRYFEITSHFGHDGFLLETEQISDIMKPIIESL